MSKYYFIKSARSDLKEIWNYSYKEWGEEKADLYLRGIDKACKQISLNPSIGRLLYGINTNVRTYDIIYSI